MQWKWCEPSLVKWCEPSLVVKTWNLKGSQGQGQDFEHQVLPLVSLCTDLFLKPRPRQLQTNSSALETQQDLGLEDNLTV